MYQHKRARSCAGRNAPSSAVRPPALHGATDACRRAGGAVWPLRPAPAGRTGSWHLIEASTTAIAASTLQSARTESPECALTCGSSTAARVRAPRGTHGTPRRGVRHGRGAGPIGRHRPLSGPRGAPWRALCPPTGRARFRVLGALRPLPFCATRATLCGACARGLVSARSRRYSSRGLGPRSTARARGASAAACARGACGGSARHSRADSARSGLAPCTVAQMTTCRRPALAARASSASPRSARPLMGGGNRHDGSNLTFPGIRVYGVF